MLHGDISNQVGVTIAFRCEDFLIKYKESSFSDKLLNKIVGKAKRAEVDEKVRSVMEHLYRNTEYTVDLVVESKNYTKDLKVIIDDLPFSRIVVVDKMTQIASRLTIGDITYYVDDDPYRRGLVNSRFAISLDDLENIIRKR